MKQRKELLILILLLITFFSIASFLYKNTPSNNNPCINYPVLRSYAIQYISSRLAFLHTRTSISISPEHAWKNLTRTLLPLKKISVKHNIPILLVGHPQFLDLKLQKKYLKFSKYFKTVCSKLNFSCLDLVPIFKNYKSQDLWIYPGDFHPNKLTQELIAKNIYIKIKEEKLDSHNK